MTKNMKSNQLVSIIMTCHNGERFLIESIKSIINQTYSNWELIFIDNFSKDKSEDIIKSFKDERIKYFKTEHLFNLGTVRQLAYNKCKGNLICFLDVDDYWSELKLEKQIIKFESNPKIEVLYTNFYRVINKDIKNNVMNFYSGFLLNKIIKSYIDGSPLTPWLTLMIKKTSIEKLDYAFDEKTHISSDFDLIIRLANFCYFDFIDESLAYYRIHEANESKNNDKEINDLVYIVYKFQKNIKINKLFFYKNFAFKIYFKYLILNKIVSKKLKQTFILKNLSTIFIYFLIKIIPRKLIKKFYKL